MSQENANPQTTSTAPAQTSALDKLKTEMELPSSEFDDTLDTPIVQAKKKPEAKAPETPVETPKVETPPTSKHDVETAGLAEDLGMTKEEIEKLEPTALKVTVRSMTRAAFRARQVDQNQPLKPVEPETPKADPFKLEFKDKDGKPHKDADGNDVNEDSYDPGIIGIMKGQAKEIAFLKQQVGYLLQERAHSDFNKMDQIFEKHGDFFGKGPRGTVAQDSVEYSRRMMVLSEAGRLAGPKATRDQILAKMPQVIAALNVGTAAAPAKTPEPEKKPEANGVNRFSPEAWNAATLATPSHRESKEPKGIARAQKAVAERLRAMGESPDQEFEGTEEEGLPD